MSFERVDLGEDVTLYRGDCLEILPTLPAGSVDAVVTDPPYGLNDGLGKVSRRNGVMTEFSAGEWDDNLVIEWIPPAVNILSDGCWFAAFTDNLSVKELWEKLVNCGANPKQTFYWIKNNPPPQPRDNFCSGVETAIVSTKGAVRKWNGGGDTLNYYRCPIVSNGDRVHPTQKPVQVMVRLVTLFTDPDEIILDPFMGSGTTGVAAVQTGRRFIGIEIEPRYFEIAVKRIQQAQLQIRMPL